MRHEMPVRQVVGLVLLLNLGFTDAFWRLLCSGNVGLARMDPLVNPGDVSDHVHTIKGGSAFSPTSFSADLAKSNCSSCDVKEDKSAYWTPALYFMNSDDNTVEVVPEKPPHKSYYFLNTGLTSDGKPQKIEPFPHGFKMIAGSSRKRNSDLPNPETNSLGPWVDESQELRAQRALGFNCLNYPKNQPEPTLSRHFMPEKSFLDQNCPDGVRLELVFPSCWNGQLDGGKGHNKHVAYPDGVMVGNCPKGFERRLVSLLYETIVATDLYKNKNGKFVFSNGDPTGYGYHGDFIEAWDTGVLQRAIDKCTNLSGNQEDCPVFTFNEAPAQCQLESPLPAVISKENVCGPRKGLPNGVKVQSGPEMAKPHNPGSNQYVPPVSPPASSSIPSSPESVPKVPTVAVSSPSRKITYTHAPTLGAQFVELKNDIVQISPSSPLILPTPEEHAAAIPTTFSTSSVASPAPAPTSISIDSPPAALGNDDAITTQVHRSGREVNELIVVLKEVTVTAAAPPVKRSPQPEPSIQIHQHKRHEHRHHGMHGIGGRRLR